MGEQQITADGVTRQLPRPFMVIATQNPVEYEGTFPLPEAQLDRFLFKLNLGYLSDKEEGEMLISLGHRHPIETLEAVVDGHNLPELAEQIWQVTVADSIREYIVALVQATRSHPDLALGASPRGSLALYRGSQARAALRGGITRCLTMCKRWRFWRCRIAALCARTRRYGAVRRNRSLPNC